MYVLESSSLKDIGIPRVKSISEVPADAKRLYCTVRHYNDLHTSPIPITYVCKSKPISLPSNSSFITIDEYNHLSEEDLKPDPLTITLITPVEEGVKPETSIAGGGPRFLHVGHGDYNVIVIYFHGMNPQGMLSGKHVTEQLELYVMGSGHYSYGFYLRGAEKSFGEHYDKDVYDLDQEFKLFKKAFESEFKNELSDPDTYIYFFGHSYGACFAKYFHMKMPEYNITSVSLDGSDLYTVVPFFISEYLKEEVDPEQITYGDKTIIYKDVNYYGNKEAKLWAKYCDVMLMLREDISHNYVIDYSPNDTDTIQFTKVENKHYANYYILKYTPEYEHCLHMYYDCVVAIFREIVQGIQELYRGVVSQVNPFSIDSCTYTVKRKDDNDVTVWLIGENDHDLHPDQVINWRTLDIRTLALFEDDNLLYDHKQDYYYMSGRYPGYWYYWREHKDMLNKLLDSDDKKYIESINKNINKSKSMSKYVTYIPCDYRNSAFENPIFKPYLWMIDANSKVRKEYDIPLEHKPMLKDIQDSGFYNSELSDEYYNKLIDEFSYSNADEFINSIKKLRSMKIVDVFNALTFNKFELEPEVKEFLSLFTGSNYPIRTTMCLCDIPMINEICKEIKTGDKLLIVTYGGSGHDIVMRAFMGMYITNECRIDFQMDACEDYIRQMWKKDDE